MDEQIAKELIRKYLDGTCSEEERVQVERFYNSITNPGKQPLDEEQLTLASEESWNLFQQHIQLSANKGRKKIFAYAAAAAIVVIFAIGYQFIYRYEPATLPTTTAKTIQDVPPGGNYATLTLANGKRINLSQAPKGTVINYSFINIKKNNDGEVVYTSSNSSASAQGEMNTVATPKGGQYIVQLADGSKVWLNAATEIKFPTDFKNLKNRIVELNGEAYFEISKNASQPFIVKTATQEVQVLGTHFNINAYTDEPSVKTTLTEGSVKVLSLSTKLKSQSLLKPGQQAILSQNKEILIQQVNPDEFIGWKDGFIRLKNADLKTIMRQVSRWYNVEIVYKSQIETAPYNGGFRRTSNLSEVLKMLESSNTHFTILEGTPRKLIIE